MIHLKLENTTTRIWNVKQPHLICSLSCLLKSKHTHFSDQTESLTCACEWICDLYHFGHNKRAKVDVGHIKITCSLCSQKSLQYNCLSVIWSSGVTQGVGRNVPATLQHIQMFLHFQEGAFSLRSLPRPKFAPSLALLFWTVGTIVRMQMRGYSYQIQWEQCFIYLRPTYINGGFFRLHTEAHIILITSNV